MSARLVKSPFYVLTILLGALPFASVCMPQAVPAPPPSTADPQFRFSTSVQMVVLQTTVLTRKGGFVKGLRQNNFQVFENAQQQSIQVFRHDDSAVAIGLLVDNSGSMKRKHSAVLAAAKAFARNSNPKDELFVINFNEQPTLGLPQTKMFSANARELERALPVSQGGGKTALFDALEMGLNHIRGLQQEKKALILVSDGGDNASTHTAEQVITHATNSDVVVYTIGLFGKDADMTDPAFMKEVAAVTGGEAFFPSRPSQAATNCKRIAQTIRSEYSLGYSPKRDSAAGAFRAIKVNVKTRRREVLIARTRKGYTLAP